MRYVSIDLETTGLQPNNHQILEVGALIDDLQNQRPLGDLPRFHCYIYSESNYYCGQPFALQMNAAILKRIAEKDKEENKIYKFLTEQEFVIEFKAWLSLNGFNDANPMTMAGKNAATFDLPFLKTVYSFDEQIKIRHRVLDCGNLFTDLINDDKIPDLRECLKRAGLGDPTDLHSAIADCWDAIRLIRAAADRQITKDK